ncbi:hypothetical protein K7G90_000265 [Pasteurella canis]|uniref:hypothetical protein n=1 Tax=Pasteurella canis TaxID=753 RepID=UPI001CC79A2D|nr:hypothetical protein [Pasteurella canis]UAY78010.1 hypothetical protein K7G90_000265 [Pasteurella canis]
MGVTLGRNLQINCSHEIFYKFLGYLANHPNDINIVHEKNSEQGAWGDEARIYFRTDFVRNNFSHFGIKVTKGIDSSIDSRLNCNTLMDKLYKLGFKLGNIQDLKLIKNNIPKEYITYFDEGASMN